MRIKHINYTILLSSSLLVGSCGILKTYDDNKTLNYIPENLYRTVNVVDSSNSADIHWKEIFQDQYLQELIDKALVQNLDLKNALLNIQQAEATFRQSKLAFFPSLSFNPQVSHNKSSKAALNFPPTVNINLKTTTIQLGFTSNWELDVWGKFAAAKRGAQSNWLQIDANKRALQTSIIANVAQLYYSLLAIDEQIAITKNTIELRRKSVNTIKALMEAAVVNGAAVVQAEANLYAAEVSLPDLEQNRREIENAICALIGEVSQDIKRSSLQSSEIINSINTGVPVQLLTNRPDIQAAEWAFRKAFENTNVAKSQFYPAFTITSANAGISALSTKNLFSESLFYSIVGGLTQPIFNRGAIKTNYKITQLQQEQAWNTFEKTVLTAGQEVSNALSLYENAVKKETFRNLQIQSLEKAVNYNMQLLEYSSSTNYTDVLTSEQALLTAKLSQIADQLQKNKATIELYRALGGGWK